MDFITVFSRFTIPLITIIILVKCLMTLLLGHPTEKTYGYIINMMTGERYALNMWETSIGRSPSNDIVIKYDLIPRFQAVITRRIDGWYIYDVFAKSNIKINGKAFSKKSTVSQGDIITFADLNFRFEITNDPVQRVGKKKKSPGQAQSRGAQRPSTQSQRTQQTGNAPQQAPLLRKNMDTAAMRRGSYTIEAPGKNQGRTRRISQPFITNKDTGETFILCGNEVTIGSGRRCDIVLSSNRVAKLHAVLVLYEDGWAIEDASSGRGTLLNGDRIQSAQLLFDGDVIALADERLYFNTGRH